MKFAFISLFSFICTFFLVLLMPLKSSAQSLQQTIRGRVVDVDSKVPLIGATVVLLDSEPVLGSTTDAAGNFQIEKVPVGRHDLQVSYIGYEPVVIHQLLVGSGKEVVLDLEMQESVASLETVEVVASDQGKDKSLNEMASVSARSFTVEETSRYAASFNDPARMAASFGGVVAATDFSNEVIIRGNSGRGLLWQVDGIPVPNPNHFSTGEGASGGGVGILTNTVLTNSDFFTGAFPAEYGNALSGVFDLKLRRGNNEKREYSLQAGFLGLQASLEGPFSRKSKSSYLVNYRYTNLSFLNKVGFEFGDATVVPKYQDLVFNLSFPTKRAGRITLFGIGGISAGGTSAKTDSTNWKYNSDRFEDGTSRDMGVLGATYTYLLPNDQTYLKLTASYAAERDIFYQDSLNSDYYPERVFRDQIENNSIRAGVLINHKFSSKHVLRGGVNYSFLSFRSLLKTGEAAGAPATQAEYIRTDLFQSYFQWQWRVNPKFTFNSGVHHTSFALNKNHTIEPRAGLRWKFRPNMVLSYGLGLHSQLEPLSIYYNNLIRPLPNSRFIWDSGNSFLFSPESTLRLTQSFHNVLGYDWTFLQNFRLKVEAYYQSLFNVPIKKEPGSTLSLLNFNSFSREFDKTDFVNRGKGRNYGFEITLEKFFSRQYYFLLTTSLFKSQYRTADGIWRNSRFDRGYVVNALGGKEWKVGQTKDHVLGANAKLVWAGGNRYTPIDLEASRAAGREILIEDRAFSERLQDYFRFDIGVSYRWNQPKYSLVATFDVQNVFNRFNVEALGYDPRSGRLEVTNQLGWVPMFNIRIEF